MAKPILIRKANGGYHVLVDVDAARRFGARGSRVRKWPAGSTVAVVREGRKADLVVGGSPSKLTKEEADHMAHMIGRYMLGFGDLVWTYTDVKNGERDRRKPRRR